MKARWSGKTRAAVCGASGVAAVAAQGPGLQHLALKSDDIVATLRKMKRVSNCGGFDFMPPLDPSYYRWVHPHLC